MDTSNHFNVGTLFDQLGLDSSPEAIEVFIEKHNLKGAEKLAEASFWNASQKAFLQQAIDDDADWAEAVDHLDAELRQS